MIVFTNGCFDLIHAGHVDFLERARSYGSRLVVGINSDASVRSIKGAGRPIHDQNARRKVLMGLRAVDEVIIFDELTPERLIKDLRPDVLIKGGDWKVDEIIGANFVTSYGGKVYSLPLVDGFSSSNIVEKLSSSDANEPRFEKTTMEVSLLEHVKVFQALSAHEIASINDAAKLIAEILASGRKLLLCGNGGSAADAQHLAAEFVGRYEAERAALPAIALTTDTSALTALSNDYGYEHVFARQVEALAAEGDCLIAISTSGTSPNVIAAVMAARKRGCRVIGMTGSKGKKLASLSDICIMVPSERTARIQEVHITVGHIWCEEVENRLRQAATRETK